MIFNVIFLKTLHIIKNNFIIFVQIINKFTIMNELVGKIADKIAEFQKDANSQIANGNKAAGTRARKSSLELEKMMKEFRKTSLEESKK